MPDEIDLDALHAVQSTDDLTDETRPYFAPGEVAVVDQFATDAVLSDEPQGGADGG